ncbi:MOSC domain containing protein [Rhodopirellula maiorica SM1]|uniref:MOSC domain containing protein n=1 Tax=Rhodopirellula maiorica SM1 TaxID=1265738 RepID=M5RKZ8_9BACT|nr:MOSC domain containing protein [Rhodopirellula maiorica SM1]
MGRPQTLGTEKPWVSGFLKKSVSDPLWLRSTNLEGDGQADLEHHGGPHKAVCVYPADHYPEWQTTLQIPDLTWGSFGENFTIADLTESDVCIGDVWSVGPATVEVSQPRQPCWKLARRWDIKTLALQVQQTGRTGWYFRVLVEGIVQQGMKITLVERPEPQWTVAEANRIMHHDKHDRDAAARLAAVSTLSPSWKTTLQNRIEKNIQPDEQKRLGGHEET